MAGVPYKDSIVEKGRLCKAKRGMQVILMVGIYEKSAYSI